MKKTLLLACLMLSFLGSTHAQEYCDNFKIVSIFDLPPSPQTPGGNYFLLLLTVEEDNLDNLDNYANLFFVDAIGDTISIPTGPSSTLPIYATDTIPYILRINSPNSNQDFPADFNGDLIIIHSFQPLCEVPYPSLPTSTGLIHEEVEIAIYPNPFVDYIKTASKNRMENILVYNATGGLIESFYPKSTSFDMNLERLNSGGYFMVVQFENGETLVHKILKR